MENSKRQVAGRAGEQRTAPCTRSEVNIATTLAKDGASPNLADVEKRLRGIQLSLLRLHLSMKCRRDGYELGEPTTPCSVPNCLPMKRVLGHEDMPKRKSMHSKLLCKF
ncbi:hypothetical protein CEXT_548751 [Caerostris extrusa]|uniref:Uncharacterized protein n=1 Tax=Caerostris extrusa TaxID=172846 RepID=A0AAV4SUX3_CAEEX|nr:hypothetical protein CEXT_548751 [Caerostris extrusa]